MKHILEKHRQHWTRKQFMISVIIGALFLAFSVTALNYAIGYTRTSQSNAVTDLILDNIPTFNVAWIVAYGPLALILLISAVTLMEPRRVPFVMKSFALLILIRSAFITFTHLAPFPERSGLIHNALLDTLGINGSSDLFFSGHAAMPFLAALIFWDNKKLRIMFLLISIFFAIVMLLGHLHYSIDIFAAFFITYTISHLCKKFFAKDYDLFHNGLKKTH